MSESPPAQDVRAILEARARKLAERPREDRTNAAGDPYLCFAVGHERFAIPLSNVGSFLDDKSIIPLPDAPPALRGLVHHEGEVLAVVAMEVLFGAAAQPMSSASLVVLAPPFDDVAIAVTEEQGIATIEHPPRTNGTGFVAFTLEDGRSVLRVDALAGDPRTNFSRRAPAAPRKD